ncbi:MAG: AAA family ATPase [Myxococcota bacterium]
MDPSDAAELEPLSPELPAALREASAYPEDESAEAGIRELQTHISHVFLSARRVYKLRKAVRPGFLDFGTREARNGDAAREVALNRRLAPDVYLGLAPVWIEPSGVRLGPVSETLATACGGREAPEHCVVMRRLPDGRDALSLLEAGQLASRQIDAIARSVADFHERVRLGTPAPFSAQEWRERICQRVDAAIPPIAGGDKLRTAAREFVAQHAARFEARRLAGRAVDAHGDLHLAHVWFESDDAEPLFIDCIEFSDDLRRIDVASEVAFLAMDLDYRKRSDLAERFLRRYARESDDFDLYSVVDFYASYRAAVRSLVAALAAEEPEVPAEQRSGAAGSARRHLDLAQRALERGAHGGLVLMCGIVGTGKSSAAEVAADALAGVVISSDRVRKRLSGLAPSDRSGAGEGIYTPERTDRVYRGLLERAQPVIASGRVAVLDATYARAAERESARAFAHARALPFRIVETRCEEAVALERLSRRERQGADPSDAGPSFHSTSAAGFEPVSEVSGDAHLVVHTDACDWRAELRSALGRAAG